MAILDCPCVNGDADAEARCEEISKRGKRFECGFHYRCDRCGCQIRLQTDEQSKAFASRAQDFTAAFTACAPIAEAPHLKALLAREISWPGYDFCYECQPKLIAWAPTMADAIYLASEVNRLNRTIQNVKKNRNNRAAA